MADASLCQYEGICVESLPATGFMVLYIVLLAIMLIGAGFGIRKLVTDDYDYPA